MLFTQIHSAHIFDEKKAAMARLTQLSDVVLGHITWEGKGSGEDGNGDLTVVETESFLLAHLSGGFPCGLNPRQINHLREQGWWSRDCRHCKHKGSDGMYFSSKRKKQTGGNFNLKKS